MLIPTSKRTLLLVVAIAAGLVTLPADAEPTKITGRDAEAAARILSASGVRVIAVGLTLAPTPPRAAAEQPAAYPPASKAEPRTEHHGCKTRRHDVVVIPPPGVTITQGPTIIYPPRSRWRT